jgi:hypothetical protein
MKAHVDVKNFSATRAQIDHSVDITRRTPRINMKDAVIVNLSSKATCWKDLLVHSELTEKKS